MMSGNMGLCSSRKKFYLKKEYPDEIRILAIGGLFNWQINRVEMAQNEGPA